jgi:hypothetical protein
MELRGTVKFCSALRSGALERRFLTVDNVRAILVSTESYNPMDSHSGPCSGQQWIAFKKAFDRALRAGVNWAEVKSEAGKVLESLEKKVKSKSEAREETRLVEISDLKLFSEWSAAWSSRNVAHVLSLFTAEGVYECLSSSVRVTGKPDLTAYFSHVFHSSEMALHVDRILTDQKREWFLHWTRVGSRCFGVQFERSQCPISIRGQSKFEVRDFVLGSGNRLSGRIEQCVEIWAIEDSDLLRRARELAFPNRTSQ